MGQINLLQSGLIAITKWIRYYKVEQLLQGRPVHLCDTRKNGYHFSQGQCGLRVKLHNMR